MLRVVWFAVLALAATNPLAQDISLLDTRYCGAPLRDEDGRIARRSDVLVVFQRLYPCPATGKPSGACPGWAKDHVIPLAVGGCDSVSNLQWLPNELKSCPGDTCKDRWERKVYRRADEPDDK